MAFQGKPAYFKDEKHPDWVPSQNLGHTDKLDDELQAAQALVDLSTTSMSMSDKNNGDTKTDQEIIDASNNTETDVTRQDTDRFKVIINDTNKSNTATETDMTGQEINKYIQCVNNMTVQIVQLKNKNMPFDEKMFEFNDGNVTYYTGLSSWHHLMYVTSLIKRALSHNEQRNVLSGFQEIIIVLMKPRLGLSNKFIGDIFKVSHSTVSRIFLKVLNVMYHNLKFLICWPTRDSLRQSMPLEFVKYFGRRVAVITDCFEIFIERPSNIKAKAETYSYYKDHNTIKYLIGITPQGSVSFISEGWGGRTSDKHIVEHSDFLSHLELGDVVLADRGFDIHDSINMRCAELKIPAFTKGKKQFSAFPRGN